MKNDCRLHNFWSSLLIFFKILQKKLCMKFFKKIKYVYKKKLISNWFHILSIYIYIYKYVSLFVKFQIERWESFFKSKLYLLRNGIGTKTKLYKNNSKVHIKIVKHRVSLLRLAKKMHQKPDDIDFLCFNLAKLQRSYQFVILTALTFVFFLLYGFLLELIYKLPGFSEHSTFLTLVQFFLYTCFSFTERNIRNDLVRK